MTKDTPDTPRTEPRWPDAFNRVIAERNEARRLVERLWPENVMHLDFPADIVPYAEIAAAMAQMDDL